MRKKVNKITVECANSGCNETFKKHPNHNQKYHNLNCSVAAMSSEERRKRVRKSNGGVGTFISRENKDNISARIQEIVDREDKTSEPFKEMDIDNYLGGLGL